MITKFTTSGEKVRVMTRNRNLGHGVQVKVIYADGSEGLEHLESLIYHENIRGVRR